MKERLKLLAPTIIVLGIVDFILPYFMAKDMGSSMLLLWGIQPVCCLVCGLLLGKKAGFVWYGGLLTLGMFLLSIPVYYNTSALVYGVVDAGVALAGCLVAVSLWHKDLLDFKILPEDAPDEEAPEAPQPPVLPHEQNNGEN